MTDDFPALTFAEAVRLKAQEKVREIRELEHQLHELEMRIARLKRYLRELNDFLVLEGQEPVALPTEEVSLT